MLIEWAFTLARRVAAVIIAALVLGGIAVGL
jgi:hypothetical protein